MAQMSQMIPWGFQCRFTFLGGQSNLMGFAHPVNLLFTSLHGNHLQVNIRKVENLKSWGVVCINAVFIEC